MFKIESFVPISFCRGSPKKKYPKINKTNQRPDFVKSGGTKLAKQKHAAHSTCYRLRIKLRRLELANSLLLVILTSSEVHNRLLRDRVRNIVEAELPGLRALGV